MQALTVPKALKLAIDAHRSGAFSEADRYYTSILKVLPNHPDANHNLGVLAVDIGKLEEALQFFKVALQANSNVEQYWDSYIAALIKLKRIEDAKSIVYQALESFPKSAKLHNYLGKIHSHSSNHNESIKAHYDALKIDPTYSEVYFNLGNVFEKTGQKDRAITAYKEALRIKPHFLEANINLGNIFREAGYLEEALATFKDALVYAPESSVAFNNLGIVFSNLGRKSEAINAFVNALRIDPQFHAALSNLSAILIGLKFNNENPSLIPLIERMLNQRSMVSPKHICSAALSLLKLDSAIHENLNISRVKNDNEYCLKVMSALNSNSLLIKLMSVCPLADLQFEELLKVLRSKLLLIFKCSEVSDEVLGFQSALALQCFTNEYIYGETTEEIEAIFDLERKIELDFQNGRWPYPAEILCLACYRPLIQFRWRHLLSSYLKLNDVYVRQVIEPENDYGISKNIPTLKPITNDLSTEVRDQYESNPYPRWVNLKLIRTPKSVIDVASEMNLNINKELINYNEAPDILIAGGGTGQHPITTSSRFLNCTILSIDLSTSSLAYAKRKTDELGINNIEYLQADILDLAKVSKNFDIIECSGVLHHMENPISGWKALIDRLKPGGLMKIGLYSEIARRHIAKIRDEIKSSNIEINNDQMKLIREKLIFSDKLHHKIILTSPDFYTLSSLRDLLFHVQEHRFTLLEIKQYLEDLGLKFCGFEAQNAKTSFQKTFGNVGDEYNLEYWHEYELQNPRTFAGMYQFWCQKTSEI